MTEFEILSTQLNLTYIDNEYGYPIYKTNYRGFFKNIKDLEKLLFHRFGVYGFFVLCIDEFANIKILYKLMHRSRILMFSEYSISIMQFEQMRLDPRDRIEVMMSEVFHNIKLEILENDVLKYIEDYNQINSRDPNIEWWIANEINSYMDTGKFRLPFFMGDIQKFMNNYLGQYGGNILLFS